MFAKDDPLLAPYEKLKRTFGGNEIVLAVYRDEELLHEDGRGLDRLEKITDDLKNVAGVDDALSLSKIHDVLKELQQERKDSIPKILLRFTNFPERGLLDPKSEVADAFRELFEGYTHAGDNDTVAVVCMLDPAASASVSRRETIEALRDVVDHLPDGLPPGMLAGEPIMVADGFRYIDEDGERLGWMSTLLLATMILLCFRSLRWVLIPVAVVQLTLLLTRATLVWSGLRLSMVSSMLTAIVTVIGVATVVHVIVRFRERRLSGATPKEALIGAGTLLAAPIVWACATDAVGFCSLLAANVGPVQDFGVMMAIGALTVIVSVALLVPPLALLGRFDVDPKQAWGEHLLESQLAQMFRCVVQKPKTVGAVTLVIGMTVAAGALRLQVESDFTKNFRADSDVVRSYRFVETNLGGAGVWDVILPAPEHLDGAYLERVADFEDELRAIRVTPRGGDQEEARLTKVISLADVDQASKALRGAKYVMPTVAGRVEKMTEHMHKFMGTLHGHDDNRHYLRIMLRSSEQQSSATKTALIAEVERISREHFPASADDNGDTPAAEVTGFYVLLANLIDSMIRDQWITFGVACLGIGLMMIVATRSVRLGLAALVPNALPIVMVTGVMGWLDLKINMGAAMIAAVSMGLSIDSSIHYLADFQRRRKQGQSRDEALAAAQQSVGRAIVFSTLALIVGFATLGFSQFVPTIYFGVLVSLSMFGGLIGNLLVLPLLLRMIVRE
jgi:predicted RND superfamily exporter protein